MDSGLVQEFLSAVTEVVEAETNEADFCIYTPLAKYRKEFSFLYDLLKKSKIAAYTWIKEENPVPNETVEMLREPFVRLCNLVITSHFSFVMLNDFRPIRYIYLDNFYLSLDEWRHSQALVRASMHKDFPFVSGLVKAAAFTLLNNKTLSIKENTVAVIVKPNNKHEELPDQRYKDHMFTVKLSGIESWAALQDMATKIEEDTREFDKSHIFIQVTSENINDMIDKAYDLLILLVKEQFSSSKMSWLVTLGSGANYSDVMSEAYTLRKELFHRFLFHCQKFKYIHWQRKLPKGANARLTMIEFLNCDDKDDTHIEYKEFTSDKKLIRIALPITLSSFRPREQREKQRYIKEIEVVKPVLPSAPPYSPKKKKKRNFLRQAIYPEQEEDNPLNLPYDSAESAPRPGYKPPAFKFPDQERYELQHLK